MLWWMHYLIILVTSIPTADFQKESGLGLIDYLAVTEAVMSCTKESNRKESYTHRSRSNKERFFIGKYAENGHAATVRKFASREKLLNESTVRRFCKRYKKN